MTQYVRSTFDVHSLILSAAADLDCRKERKLSEPAFRVLCILYRMFCLSDNAYSTDIDSFDLLDWIKKKSSMAKESAHTFHVETECLYECINSFSKEKIQKCLYALKKLNYIEYNTINDIVENKIYLRVTFLIPKYVKVLSERQQIPLNGNVALPRKYERK